MKLFIKNFFVFIIPLLIIIIPLDLTLSKLLKKSNTYAQGEYSVWNDLYNGKVNSEIVIYGSSRAWVHVDPQILKNELGVSSYNLGIDGHNFWLQYLRHKILLKYNQKPKYIILSVDSRTLEKRDNLFNSHQFLPYMLWDKDIINFTKSYYGYSNIDYYLPLLRYYGKKIVLVEATNNFLFSSNLKLDRNNGFKGMDRQWNNDFENAKNKLKHYKAELNQESIQLFDRFLGECKENDMEAIFVYTPEFIEGQEFIQNREEIISLFKDFSDKYNISFLDYSDDEICSQKKYFYNASHLNKEGAEIFTKKLAEDLKSIISQGY
jgi:hypothetical protein